MYSQFCTFDIFSMFSIRYSMKKGEIVGIRRQLPADAPFRSYREIKRYWKNSVSIQSIVKFSFYWILCSLTVKEKINFAEQQFFLCICLVFFHTLENNKIRSFRNTDYSWWTWQLNWTTCRCHVHPPRKLEIYNMANSSRRISWHSSFNTFP